MVKEQTMDSFSSLSRRRFVGLGLSAAALAPLAGPGPVGEAWAAAPDASTASDPWRGLKVGIASYTFSRLPLDATIDAIRKLGVGYVSIKDSHLPMKSSTAERKAVAK